MTDEEYDAMAVEYYRMLLLSKKLYDYVVENNLLESTEGTVHNRYESYLENARKKYIIAIE